MDVNSKFNYYDILEVSPQCPQHEVTTAYERMRLTYGGENPAIYTIFSEEEARSMLGLVEEAYSVLGNKSLRSLYDEKLLLASSKSPEINADSLKLRVPTNTLPKKSTFVRPIFKVDPTFEDKIRACSEWTGEMLKKVREYKGWTIEGLAETTKISGYYIAGIEAVNPKALPAAVYVRGYVSQICKTLALEERKVCDSYMKLFKQSLGSK